MWPHDLKLRPSAARVGGAHQRRTNSNARFQHEVEWNFPMPRMGCLRLLFGRDGDRTGGLIYGNSWDIRDCRLRSAVMLIADVNQPLIGLPAAADKVDIRGSAVFPRNPLFIHQAGTSTWATYSGR